MKNISFVFQNTTLFKDSIYNNVAIGRKGASREDVKKSIELNPNVTILLMSFQME